MSFGIYLAGSIVLIVGLALGAHMAHEGYTTRAGNAAASA